MSLDISMLKKDCWVAHKETASNILISVLTSISKFTPQSWREIKDETKVFQLVSFYIQCCWKRLLFWHYHSMHCKSQKTPTCKVLFAWSVVSLSLLTITCWTFIIASTKHVHSLSLSNRLQSQAQLQESCWNMDRFHGMLLLSCGWFSLACIQINCFERKKSQYWSKFLFREGQTSQVYLTEIHWFTKYYLMWISFDF